MLGRILANINRPESIMFFPYTHLTPTFPNILHLAKSPPQSQVCTPIETFFQTFDKIEFSSCQYLFSQPFAKGALIIYLTTCQVLAFKARRRWIYPCAGTLRTTYQ